jgi:hypothetical protein
VAHSLNADVLFNKGHVFIFLLVSFMWVQLAQPCDIVKNRTARREARVLADVYGQMIFPRADAIDAASLNSEQIQALTSALDQRGVSR